MYKNGTVTLRKEEKKTYYQHQIDENKKVKKMWLGINT